MSLITTSDLTEDLVSEDAEDIDREGATLTVEQKAEKYPKTLLGANDDLTVKEREKQRLGLN